ncbi:hypothetical protein N0V90_003790 [Kalmusia sp. IMI 367209]|nr:hypothetical protein N0V90_003790 [Kalmusia sp. IMI 367209]
MFMRTRGHTCDICLRVDEAHYKRHFDLAEQIRSIYECCSEEWSIIPDDESNRVRNRSKDSDAFDSDDRSSSSGDVIVTKREKKERKRQTRAASRAKVLTQEDIKYIDSVLHPAASHGHAENPNNFEEVEEIERHLRYNAQCYSTGAKRRDIRDFTHISDADIDFDAEMDRIFEVFRVTELLKRNERHRGLRSKELAHFRALVASLISQIMDDLVSVKRDELEIRMRRAGFLRYTGRPCYDIVERRYENMDWKTGEKLPSNGSGSGSSGSLTAVEDEGDEGDRTSETETPDEKFRSSTTLILNDADRRHLQQSHMKIVGDGSLEEVNIIQTQPIRSALREKSIPKLPSLRILNTNVIKPPQIRFRNPWKRQNSVDAKPCIIKRSIQTPSPKESESKRPALDSDDGWQTVGVIASPLAIPMASTLQTSPKLSVAQLNPLDVHGISSCPNSSKTEPGTSLNIANKLNTMRRKFNDEKSRNPNNLEQNITHFSMNNFEENEQITETAIINAAPVNSRKKDKKKQREAERKSRRAAEGRPSPSIEADVSDALSGGSKANASDLASSSADSISNKGLDDGSGSSHLSKPVNHMSAIETDDNDNGTRAKDTRASEGHLKPSPLLEVPPPVPTTNSGRHDDWMKYVNLTKVDCLSGSVSTTSHVYCNFGEEELSKCIGMPDCPYDSSFCACVDPLNPSNDKYIIYAETNPDALGPFSYHRGEKLMRFFESRPETKGRLMLVDAELYHWITTEGRSWSVEKAKREGTEILGMPKRLSVEVDDYFRGYEKGKTVKQLEQYQELADRNDRLCTRKITRDLLEQMRKECEHGAPGTSICYCKDVMPARPDDDEFVECGFRECPFRFFHRSCIKDLGFEKVTTWYCALCECTMLWIALKALDEVSAMRTGAPALDDDGAEFWKKKLHAGCVAVDARLVERRHGCH